MASPDEEQPRSALIFLGTGCSSALPNALCLLRPRDPPCVVCHQSLSIPPEKNPNYRCNTSLLIDYCQPGNHHKYILIDVGKTFREQVLRWFTFYNIPQVDSIILSHEHADAILGLDDIRVVQPFSATNDIGPTPIYLTQHSMESISMKFPYLVQKKLKAGQEVRRVAQLDWKIVEADCEKAFVASGLEIIPLPVMHGEDYLCLGFLFGGNCKVAYLSDVSRILSTTESYISKDNGQQLDLLILDTLYKIGPFLRLLYCSHHSLLFYLSSPAQSLCLRCPMHLLDFPHVEGSHNTHFCFPQSLAAVKRLCPKQALFIGMTHEFDHHRDNEFLKEWSEREGITVQLAHDGLKIPINL